ncbi:TetR/AcrR family transcriptional regulator [Nocardiopsis protaetiae]|uniref:TetR/AcrR family transcriptional regulator n=1 Tax=Nocardiopsis protaetiae TaxID=3382270 RepID=UPI00387B02F2
MEKDTRARILDAAALIIRRDGLARATTRRIAKAAGCSEALLYKYFPDKQEIFLRVLTERVPRVAAVDELIGVNDVRANLRLLIAQMLAFYQESFPMAASIFGDTALLDAHREGMRARGAGPHVPAALVAAYITAEQEAGRVRPEVDGDAVARLLVGAALHEAFLANYRGEGLDAPEELADRLVAAVLPAGTGPSED